MNSLIGHGINIQGQDYEIVGETGGDAYSVGGDTIFDNFDTIPYTFLTISRGGVYGNKILFRTDATGVFKLRSGMNTQNNQETRQSDATLHIRPTESFLTDMPSNREHIRVTLQIADFSEFDYGS